MTSDDHTGLPEPNRTMPPSGQVWYLKGPVGDVRAVPGSVVAFGLWKEQPFRIVATPEEAMKLARTLEAAAHHARETTPQPIPAEQAQELQDRINQLDNELTHVTAHSLAQGKKLRAKTMQVERLQRAVRFLESVWGSDILTELQEKGIIQTEDMA
jgi:hypothetical protein